MLKRFDFPNGLSIINEDEDYVENARYSLRGMRM